MESPIVLITITTANAMITYRLGYIPYAPVNSGRPCTKINILRAIRCEFFIKDADLFKYFGANKLGTTDLKVRIAFPVKLSVIRLIDPSNGVHEAWRKFAE